jgi:hypothetical protein
MSIAIVADPCAQFQTQQVAVKANGRGHVIGDEREMIDSLQAHGIQPVLLGLATINLLYPTVTASAKQGLSLFSLTGR